jgi:hypothetical protein
MEIEISVEGTAIQGQLNDGPAAFDLASLLPVTLNLTDYASTEKIAYLPRKLRVQGEPPGTDAQSGDICYYVPWGNLALFYKPAPFAEGLVKLGVITSGLEALHVGDRFHATIRMRSRH